MNCIYCQEPCHGGHLNRNVFGEIEDEVWTCSNHPTPVNHYLRMVRKKNCKCQDWADQNCCPYQEHYKTIMEIPRSNGRTYLAIFQDNRLHIQDFNGMQAWNVMDIDIPVNLTPENIARKLPLWVIFS